MNSKTNIENEQSASLRSGDLFGISGCNNCPFNAAKYCKLLQWLSSESGTQASAWVCEEWRSGSMPDKCPLRKHALTFVPNVKAEPRAEK